MAHYVFSDLHGNYALWGKIKNYITNNDTVYFLGDAIDRGPDGWKIFKEIIDHPNVIYICGNHEDMMYNAYREGFEGYNTRLWFNNNARPTYEALMRDAEAFDYIENIPLLPIHVEYIRDDGVKIYMTHSGNTLVDEVNNAEEIDRDSALWDRSHYYTTCWWGAKNEYVIHGHTPIPYIMDAIGIRSNDEEVPFPLHYCEGHKIDIDCLTILTGTTVLFNLDTFEAVTFEEDKE